MNTAFLVWAYLVIGNLVGWSIGFFIFYAIISGAFAFVLFWALDDSTDDEEKEAIMSIVSKWLKFSVWFVPIVITLTSVYPSKEEVAWIVGGAAAVEVAHMEEAQQLPENVLKAMNTFLEGLEAKSD